MRYSFSSNKANKCIHNIRSSIQLYFRENNLSYAVFGKSEGLDSSVIAGLLSNLEGVKPIGVIMPCDSNPAAKLIGDKVLKHFNIPSIHVDLTSEFYLLMSLFYKSGSVCDQLTKILESYKDKKIAENLTVIKARAAGNIKARLRMIALYHIAQLAGGVVVSTDNLSEMWMGFWTLNGDVGDISPIQYVFKGIEEYTIAKELGVPEESLNAAPTDGLDVIPGGTDEDQLGMPYNDLDAVIIRLLQNKFDGNINFSSDEKTVLFNKIAKETKNSTDAVAHVAKQLKSTHYKRSWPKAFKREEIGLPDIKDMEIV